MNFARGFEKLIYPNNPHVSLEDFLRNSKNLAEKVRSSGYNPDCVVGIERGAELPATVIANELDSRISFMRVQHHSPLNSLLRIGLKKSWS